MQTREHTDYGGLDELINVELAMPGYNESIVNKFARALEGRTKVLDFGAGIGTLSDIFYQKTGRLPLCVEIDQKGRSHLKKRGFPVFENLSDVGAKVDGIFSSNVLEHIEDDRAILKELHDKLLPNGRLVLYLPAFQMLFSGLDESVGHYRRYGRRDLKEKLEQAGFQVKSIHYAESAGFFASLLVKCLGYDPDKGLGTPSSLKIYDRFVFPLNRELDALGLRYLFGKNIVAVAEKI